MASGVLLDDYWGEAAAPVLRRAGFRKHGRLYRFDAPDDGYAFVHPSPYPGDTFRIAVAVAVAPVTRLLAWWNDAPGHIGDAAWSTHLGRARPGTPYAGDWPIVEAGPAREAARAELAAYLSDEAIPLLMRLLDLGELREEITHRHVGGMTPVGEYALVLALLAARGARTELDELLAVRPSSEFERRAQAYARQVLAGGTF